MKTAGKEDLKGYPNQRRGNKTAGRLWESVKLETEVCTATEEN